MATEASQRIWKALGSMPYGAGANFVYPGRSTDEWTLELVATNLEHLRDALQGIAKSNEADGQELREIKADLAAWGRLMNRAQAYR